MHHCEIVIGAALERGTGEIVLQVGGKQANCAEQAGMAGNDDRAAAERARKLDRVQGTGAAEGDKAEVPRVIAALDRDDLQRSRHVGIYDANDSFGRFLDGNRERMRQFALNRGTSLFNIEPHVACEQRRR